MYKKIITFMLAISLCMSCTACNNKDTNSTNETTSNNLDDAVISQKETEDDSQQDTTSATEETTTTTEVTKHESPIETVSYEMCGQVSDTNEIMDYDKNKNKKISLKDLVPSGAKIKSFKFVFYSNDDTNIGTYKGGCGISVNDDCPSATDDGWYQSEDFEATADGTYLEVDWNVPSDIQDYINTNGDVQIGYWWSDTSKLKLSEVICSYSNSAEIPCDETQSKDYTQTLTYSDDDAKTMKVSLKDLVSKGNVPQYISVTVCNSDATSSATMGKLVMGMGISKGEDYYESPNMVQISKDGSNQTFSWLIDDSIKSKIDSSGDLTIGYWWGEIPSINVIKVEVKSAVADGSKVSDSNDKDQNKDTGKEPIAEDTSTISGDIKDITSAQIVEDIKIGWNLGNSLDSYDKDNSKIVGSAETYWGNPLTTKAMIDKVKSAGFKAVRIPISWTNHIDDNDNIDQEWLNRVKEVVNYVIDNDMYAIINVHHDDYTWFNPTYADQEKVSKRLTDIWTTLSTEFKDYDQHLLFEGMNEPRVIGGTDEWTCGTEEERDVINQLAQQFVDTVRKSGGNNTYRTLIVTTHAASLDETSVKALKVPNDDRVIVSVHYYSPYDFAGNESDVNTWGSDEDKANLDKGFKLLNDTFISKGIPVIIGEFGAVDKDNDSTRATYYQYYVQSAKKYGIPCFIWDNDDDFNLLDRTSLTWYNNSLVNALMDGVNN